MQILNWLNVRSAVTAGLILGTVVLATQGVHISPLDVIPGGLGPMSGVGLI